MLHDMQSFIKPVSWFAVFLHCPGSGTIGKLSTCSSSVALSKGLCCHEIENKPEENYSQKLFHLPSG